MLTLATRLDPSGSTQQAEPAADPPSVVVDEGEIGETDWSREGWEPTGVPLTSGAAVEERLSQTIYDDGDSTWRIINAVAAWRTTADRADLPTDAQFDAVAAPL